MRVPILTLFLLLAGASHGEVTQAPIRLGVVLQPNEGYTVTIEAPAPTEIFWRMAGTKRCSTNCVLATELTSPSHMAFAAAMGGQQALYAVFGQDRHRIQECFERGGHD